MCKQLKHVMDIISPRGQNQMSKFKAFMVNRSEDRSISHEIAKINLDDLPEDGDVLVQIDFSTVNYKDGMCISGLGGLVRQYPHIPGIDFVGEVIESKDSRYAIGDKVVLTGWRVGEAWWGGYAQFARVKANWLVPLQDGLSPYEAMSIGTAGLTAMLSIIALEKYGITKDDGEILVTGATGGVGTIATSLLSALKYDVVVVTGRPEHTEYLKSLGAKDIILREDLVNGEQKPLQSAKWAACVDSVGGEMLSKILPQIKPRGAVACVGNTGGNELVSNIIPFMLRGIALIGIDSASSLYDLRIQAWKKLAEILPKKTITEVTSTIGLSELGNAATEVLSGRVRGRIVVDVNK